MKRRNFLTLLAGLAGAPLAVSAAQTAPLLGATTAAQLPPVADILLSKDTQGIPGVLAKTLWQVGHAQQLVVAWGYTEMDAVWQVTRRLAMTKHGYPVPFSQMDLSIPYPFGQPVFWIRTVALPGKEQA